MGHDLAPAQVTLPCAVKDESRHVAGLAASLGMTKNALGQLVDRTERRGLVRRESREHDRRGVTPAGEVLTEAVYAERLPDVVDGLGVVRDRR